MAEKVQAATTSTKAEAEAEAEAEDATRNEYKDNVSSRGFKVSNSPILPYFGQMMEALPDQCSLTITNGNDNGDQDENKSKSKSKSNPTGYIIVCVAENKLILQNHLTTHLTQLSYAQAAFGDEITFCYNNMCGLDYVREAVARFITRKFIQSTSEAATASSLLSSSSSSSLVAALGTNKDDETEKETLVANAEQIVLASGAASVLNTLCYTLADENDVILIPAPYYAAFDFDTSIIAKLSTYPVYMIDPILGPQPSDLDAVYEKLTSQGKRVRMLLLTNPNNPLGTIYSDSVIRNCIDWSRSKGMHTIVDEIYALSVHEKSSNKFQSVSNILKNKLGNDVHLVWALSKDFGASGFRIGILYTQNNTVISAAGNINNFSCVSHPMQAVIAKLLSDDDYVDQFLDESRMLLKASLAIVTSTLETMTIPFVTPEAGIFVYCDFSSLLPEQTFEGEDTFSNLMYKYAKILMTPGHCQRESKPGYFRICYASVTPEVLTVGMKRLETLVQLLKEHGWENIRSNVDEDTVLKC